MATQLEQSEHTLVELANRSQDSMLQDVLLKAAENEILGDMKYKAANGGQIHKESTFENLPAATFGGLGGFWPSVKASARQLEEKCFHTSQFSVVPVDIGRASGNWKAYRKSEDDAVVEGIMQSIADKIIYGDGLTDPMQPLGLRYRLNALSMSNVLGAGGTSGGLTSIYVIKQDPRAFFGIYSKGQEAGMQVEDQGIQTEFDGTSRRRVYQTQYTWDMGFMIRDPRVVWRIANIPVPASDMDESAFAKWNHLLIRILNTVPGRNAGMMRIYMNSDLLTQLDIMHLTKGNAYYTPASPDGQIPAAFRGIPLRRTDAILSTETQIT